MGVMVRMSLNFEGKGGCNAAPGVDVANAFVDTVLILPSSETIVLQVVDRFQPEHALEGVVELKHEPTVPEKPVSSIC